MKSQTKQEREEDILRKRSLELARVGVGNMDSEEKGLFVVRFLLSPEIYCIESRFVQEVLPLAEMAVIPGTPSFLPGVINCRGRIFPVIDPKKFFNLPEKGITQFNKVILIDYPPVRFGLISDAIEGTAFIPFQHIAPPPQGLSGAGSDFIRGVGPDGSIILDGEELVNSSRILVNQKSS